MKSQLFALLSLSALLTSSSILPAPAAHAANVCHASGTSFSYAPKDFKYWEKPFLCDQNIGNMTQNQANAYCKTVFGFQAAGMFLTAQGVPSNPHIWAHLNDRLCVYNTNK